MKRWIIPLVIVLIFAAFIVAQEDEMQPGGDEPVLWLSVAGETCALEMTDSGGMPRGILLKNSHVLSHNLPIYLTKAGC